MKRELPKDPVSVESLPQPVMAARTASRRPLPTGTGPVPVNSISPMVQLTPVIQPIAMVPYSTQNQDLMAYLDEPEEEAVAEPAAFAQPVATVKAKERKRIRLAPVLLILFSLLILAVYVVGNFVIPKYLALIGEEAAGSGLGIIMGMFKASEGGFDLMDMLPKIAILATAVMTVIVLLASLIGITRKKATVVAKIALVLALLFALVALAVLIVQSLTGAGMYIVAGLCLIAMLLGFLVRSKK